MAQVRSPFSHTPVAVPHDTRGGAPRHAGMPPEGVGAGVGVAEGVGAGVGVGVGAGPPGVAGVGMGPGSEVVEGAGLGDSVVVVVVVVGASGSDGRRLPHAVSKAMPQAPISAACTSPLSRQNTRLIMLVLLASIGTHGAAGALRVALGILVHAPGEHKLSLSNTRIRFVRRAKSKDVVPDGAGISASGRTTLKSRVARRRALRTTRSMSRRGARVQGHDRGRRQPWLVTDDSSRMAAVTPPRRRRAASERP